jgi:Ankyrin repeats (many copies)
MNFRILPTHTTEEGTRILKQLLEKEGVEVTQILERLRGDQRFLAGAAAIEADMANDTNCAVPLIQSGLLNEASDPNGHGYKLIHHAAAWDHVAAIEAFAGIGVDPNSTNCVGNTSLHCAVGNQQLKAVTALIANGADPEPTTFKIKTTPEKIVTPEDIARLKSEKFHEQYLAAVEEGRRLKLDQSRGARVTRAEVNVAFSMHGTNGKGYLAAPRDRPPEF